MLLALPLQSFGRIGMREKALYKAVLLLSEKFQVNVKSLRPVLAPSSGALSSAPAASGHSQLFTLAPALVCVYVDTVVCPGASTPKMCFSHGSATNGPACRFRQ